MKKLKKLWTFPENGTRGTSGSRANIYLYYMGKAILGNGNMGEKKISMHGMHRRCGREIMTRWHRGDDAVTQEYHRDGTGVPTWWDWSTTVVVLE